MRQLLVFGAACIAGVINAVAAGGTLISFPTLIWVGIPSVAANATSTVALLPGSFGSVLGYRRELRGLNPHVYALVVPSAVGGVLGAILLYRTPTDVFDRLVPILIFFATCLFMAQESIQRRFNLEAAAHSASPWLSWAMLYQLVVGVYGGYFGAGIGILMLAALTVMGHTNIHQMNALKNLLAGCMNGVAAAYFIWSGLIVWNDALVMAVGALVGGAGGAGLARRMGRQTIRRIVVVVGFAMALSLMLKL